MAYIMSQFPSVAEHGIMSYSTFSPNTTLNGTIYNTTFNGSLYGVYQGLFVLPILSPSNSSSSVMDVLSPIWKNITMTYPDQISFSFSAATYPSFYSWWINYNGPNDAGFDIIVGSHRLDIPSLTANVTALKEAMKAFTPPGGGGGKHGEYGVRKGRLECHTQRWEQCRLEEVLGAIWYIQCPLSYDGRCKKRI
jgi:hypothetical protein